MKKKIKNWTKMFSSHIIISNNLKEMRTENSEISSSNPQSLVSSFNFKEKEHLLVYWFPCHRWHDNPAGWVKQSTKARPPEDETINAYVRVHHYLTSYGQGKPKSEKYQSWSDFSASFERTGSFLFVFSECLTFCKLFMAHLSIN